jgi:hypothetical protein
MVDMGRSESKTENLYHSRTTPESAVIRVIYLIVQPRAHIVSLIFPPSTALWLFFISYAPVTQCLTRLDTICMAWLEKTILVLEIFLEETDLLPPVLGNYYTHPFNR